MGFEIYFMWQGCCYWQKTISSMEQSDWIYNCGNESHEKYVVIWSRCICCSHIMFLWYSKILIKITRDSVIICVNAYGVCVCVSVLLHCNICVCVSNGGLSSVWHLYMLFCSEARCCRNWDGNSVFTVNIATNQPFQKPYEMTCLSKEVTQTDSNLFLVI